MNLAAVQGEGKLVGLESEILEALLLESLMDRAEPTLLDNLQRVSLKCHSGCCDKEIGLKWLFTQEAMIIPQEVEYNVVDVAEMEAVAVRLWEVDRM